jgi:hypothetical protein
MRSIPDSLGSSRVFNPSIDPAQFKMNAVHITKNPNKKALKGFSRSAFTANPHRYGFILQKFRGSILKNI